MILSAPTPRRIALLSCMLASALLFAAPASARVVATINGADITDEDVAVAMEDLGPTLPRELDAAQRASYVLDYLIDTKMVAQKAVADKVADQPDFQRKLAYYRDKALMESVLGTVAKDSSTDAAMHKVYDDAAKAQKPEPEAHASHILVETEEQAKAVIARLKAGEDFAKVAKEVSKDPGSEGGDLGWFTKDRMVPEFADAAFAMEPGQLSAPVKSQFGWHVIRLDEKRTRPFPAFEAVKDQVARYVVQKAQADLITGLRKDAKIDKMDAPAPGAAPPPAAAPKP